MKSIPKIILVSALFCIANMKTYSQQPVIFFIGTYTGGESNGIYASALNSDGTIEKVSLATETPNPSFVAKSMDSKYLVSISEVSARDKTGKVKSYRIEDDSLVFISESTSGGAHPCFVSINHEGFVLVANYTGGNTALLNMNSEGQLSELQDLKQHEGSDITERQKGPHAHSAWFVPGSNQVISVDLGTNDLWLYDLDPVEKKLVPGNPAILSMKPGAGPRHLDFHPNGKWIYVVNELDCTVTQVKIGKKGKLKALESVSTLPADFQDKNTCADIHVSNDGRYIYASNRGHNSIAIFSVDSKKGSLTPVGHASTYGETPRNFSLSPDNKYLLVANQNSNNIVSYKRDSKTGLLEKIDEIYAPKPVCIRF